jgi:hypothetical protein
MKYFPSHLTVGFSGIEDCRFRGFRVITNSNERENFFYGPRVDPPSLCFNEWDPPRTLHEVNLLRVRGYHMLLPVATNNTLQRATAGFLLPKLRNELEHTSRPDALYKTFRLDTRDICGLHLHILLCHGLLLTSN